MERTIRVTGTGSVSLKPDITIITLQMTDVCDKYEDCLESSVFALNEVKWALEKVGINKKDVKTTYFNVDAYYESHYENGIHESIFKGYRYHQTVKFEFDIDNTLLGKVLYEIGQLSISPELSINYGIKDVEDAKNKLLSNAVKDAQKKAEIIANAANVELDQILDINYSWLDIEFMSRSYDMDVSYCCKSKPETGAYNIDIDPEDIEKRDNITVVYRIK